MRGIVNFGHFCSARNDLGWNFYRKLGEPQFDFISLLPETALPEIRLTHHYTNIQKIHELLGLEESYDQVRLHYEEHAYSHDTRRITEASQKSEDIKDIHLLSNDSMQRYMQPEWDRKITYASFYPLEVEELFRDLYHEEFEFYRGFNLNFQP